MPRYGHIADTILASIYSQLSQVGLSLKGTPQRRYATTSGEVQATPGASLRLRVYGILIVNEGDEITRLRYGGAAGTVFAVLPTKGILGLNLLGINEVGGLNQNIYMEKTAAGNVLVVVWTEAVS